MILEVYAWQEISAAYEEGSRSFKTKMHNHDASSPGSLPLCIHRG